jgi:Fe-S cluster biosynthesis and repair protein YggX
MVEDSEDEKQFRQRYSDELKKKKHGGRDTDLDVERIEVKQQGMKTPGRRGEQIKNEEIDKEIVRRYTSRQQKKIDEKKLLSRLDSSALKLVQRELEESK